MNKVGILVRLLILAIFLMFSLPLSGVFAESEYGSLVLYRADYDSNKCSYHFSAGTYGGLSHGEFYYSTGNKLYANNVGQLGLIDLGPDSPFDPAKIDIPSTGFNIYGVAATPGHVYVTPARQGEEYRYILFRVNYFSLEGQAIGLEYHILETGNIVVMTNQQAGFRILGPRTFTGEGTLWEKERTLTGEYTIIFDPIVGYQTPASQQKLLGLGSNIVFDAEYYLIEPDAPTGLTATAVSSTQINLLWTDNSANEDGFKIERRTGTAGTFFEIATVKSGAITYFDKTCEPDTTYYYRVTAFNDAGDSPYSNLTNSTTPPPKPAAPTDLTSKAVSSTRIDLSWTDNSAYEDGFKIERRTGTAGTYSLIDTVGPDVTAHPDQTCEPVTTYHYRVSAFNEAGDSPYSNLTNSNTPPPEPDAPTGLTSTAVSSTRIDLYWTDNSAYEDGFKIERTTGTVGAYSQIDSVGPNVTAHSDPDCKPGITYHYRVRAFNDAGDSPYSNSDSATTHQAPPAAPTGLTSTAVSSTQIDLSWTDNSENEDGFKIECRMDTAGAYSQIAMVGPDETTYPDSGRDPGTTYYYRVSAFNEAGESPYSSLASATTTKDDTGDGTGLPIEVIAALIGTLGTVIAAYLGYLAVTRSRRHN